VASAAPDRPAGGGARFAPPADQPLAAGANGAAPAAAPAGPVAITGEVFSVGVLTPAQIYNKVRHTHKSPHPQ
jgi:hypothetical protein